MTSTTPPSDRHLAAREAAIKLLEETCDYLKVDSPPLRLFAVLDDCKGSYFVKDSAGLITYASPEFVCQFSGGEDVTGQRESDFMPEDVRPLLARADDLVLKQQRVAAFLFRFAHADGLEVSVQTHRVPLVSGDEVVGMFGVAHELLPGQGAEQTARLVSMEELARLDERERELAQMLSHGAINKQLASHFDVSIRSVENWRRSLLSKLELETIPALTRWVVRMEDFGFLPAV